MFGLPNIRASREQVHVTGVRTSAWPARRDIAGRWRRLRRLEGHRPGCRLDAFSPLRCRKLPEHRMRHRTSVPLCERTWNTRGRTARHTHERTR